MEGKGGQKRVALVTAFFFIGVFSLIQLGRAQEESSCVKCHTSPKTLIELTRALAAKKPPKKSAETKGEG